MERKRDGILPEELVHQILLRMSVKTLLVCKCVCKKWRALIKSSSFINQHFNHESNQDCLLFRLDSVHIFSNQNQYSHTRYLDDVRPSRVNNSNIPQLPTDRGAKQLIGPENGVFCLVRDLIPFILLNPATREFKKIPRLPIRVDPDNDSPLIGFGLDPSSGDFKVVVYEQTDNNACVYNKSSDSWKRIEVVKAAEIFDFGYDGYNHRIFNGVNYWLGKISSVRPWLGEYADRVGSNFILTFDMRSEKFQEMPIPRHLRNTTRDLRITRCHDSIVVMSYDWEECVELWVMERDGLLSKSFRIGPFDQELAVWPLCMWKNDEVFFGTSYKTLIVYDITTRKVRTLIRGNVPQKEESVDPYVCDHFIYKESLVSFK